MRYCMEGDHHYKSSEHGTIDEVLNDEFSILGEGIEIYTLEVSNSINSSEGEVVKLLVPPCNYILWIFHFYALLGLTTILSTKILVKHL
jgi:hypothetical protein